LISKSVLDNQGILANRAKQVAILEPNCSTDEGESPSH
jgi:hypothetical protein